MYITFLMEGGKKELAKEFEMHDNKNAVRQIIELILYKEMSLLFAVSLYFATRELRRKAKIRNMKLFPYSKFGTLFICNLFAV